MRRGGPHSGAAGVCGAVRAADADRRVVTFPNLGNDAVLVVPCPSAGVADAAYVHLAAFVRHAPAAQVHELWRAVGAAMEAG